MNSELVNLFNRSKQGLKFKRHIKLINIDYGYFSIRIQDSLAKKHLGEIEKRFKCKLVSWHSDLTKKITHPKVVHLHFVFKRRQETTNLFIR